jgi:chemotaxis response regulator CheB
MLEQSSSAAKSVTKVGVLASSEEQREILQSILQQSGLEIILCAALNGDTLEHLTKDQPDVLLVDIAEDSDDEFDIIDSISDQTDIPMLLNDSGNEGINVSASGDIWARKLAQKLIALAEAEASSTKNASAEEPYPLSSRQAAEATSDQPDTEVSVPDIDSSAGAGNSPEQNSFAPDNIEAVISIAESQSGPNEGATENVAEAQEPSELNVWVLGASLGGPQAVRQFLAAISEALPVAFILAQHIGANHINLLAEQLNRVSAFTVIPGKNGHRLRHGEVILTPADKEISFTDDGYLALKPAQPGAIYSPSIDNVMATVAKTFGDRAGTIVFSGMGDDGAQGVEAIAEHQGIVWAQDIASCVVSSMPDHARKTGKVSFSATPEKLAEALYTHYCK